MEHYDVIVIGGGPAGYVAAIRAAQLGKNVACVEKWRSNDKPVLGGTCLNVGCIPSKALLDSAYKYKALQNLEDHGITVENTSIDVSKMMASKNKIVQQLTKGIEGLFKANKVTSVYGYATLLANKEVSVKKHDGSIDIISAENIIIATGSVPVAISVAPINNTSVVDSTGALSFDSVPKNVCIIGAGVIGLELGSVWNWLGSKVVVLEAMSDFLAMMDRDIARETSEILTNHGMNIKLNASVTKVDSDGDRAKVSYILEDKEQQQTFDKVIVCVGRKPWTENLISKDVDLKLDDRGCICVNDICATNIEGIWAIGDVVRGPMLAHKGSEEGVMVAERIAGQHTQVNYDLIPSVIYTHPEVASVGKTEKQLKDEGIKYRIGKFHFNANGRALAAREATGFVKILAEDKTDIIQGVHCIGPNAAEIIQQALIAMEFSASAEDLGLMMFAHPTVSEGLHEAALNVHHHAIHMLNKG